MPCKKLTQKQKAFAHKEVELKNSTEAVMQVYNCKNRTTAANMACRLNKNPKIQREIELALAKANVSEDTIADTLGEATKANVVTVADGMAVESKVPDHQTRIKAATEIAKLLGSYAPQRIESRNLNIDLELEKMPPKELAFLLKQLAHEIYAESSSEKELGVAVSGNESGKTAESKE